MRDELTRILALVQAGKLTDEQAADMIEAILSRESRGQEEPVIERTGRQGSRRHRRERHARSSDKSSRKRGSFGSEIAGAVNQSLRGLTRQLGPVSWVNDSNTSVMSKLHEPDGEDFTCEGNRLHVSQLAELSLSHSRFCENQLNAAGIRDMELEQSSFCDNSLHGSSIKGTTLAHSDFNHVELHGATLNDLSITNGKVEECAFHGCQIRDVTLDHATLADAEFSGVRGSDLNCTEGASLTGLRMRGVKLRDVTVADSQLDKVRISGMAMESVDIRHSALSEVTFRCLDHQDSGAHPESSYMTDLTLDGFRARRVKFINCRFEGATFQDCEIEDMTFTAVDFVDRTFATRDAFLEFADHEVA